MGNLVGTDVGHADESNEDVHEHAKYPGGPYMKLLALLTGNYGMDSTKASAVLSKIIEKAGTDGLQDLYWKHYRSSPEDFEVALAILGINICRPTQCAYDSSVLFAQVLIASTQLPRKHQVQHPHASYLAF